MSKNENDNESTLLGQALLDTIKLAVREEVRSAFREARYGEDRLISIEEAAKILAVSKDWLYRNTTRLPFTRRVGKHVGFSFKGLQRWVDTRRIS